MKNIERRCKNIHWLSYHIPKTAGTSFRKTLCDAFGDDVVYGAYASTNAKELTKGEIVWIPRSTKLLHGHFNPHRNHESHFENAKKIIWLRDPVKRAWSLLNHTLDVNNNQLVMDYIKQKFKDQPDLSREEMFLSVLADNKSKRFFTKYDSSLKNFPKSFFNFIGNTEEYGQGLNRLSDMMNKELKNHQSNVSINKTPPPNIPPALLNYFDKDYIIYDKFISG